jgi:hypothetical protein
VPFVATDVWTEETMNYFASSGTSPPEATMRVGMQRKIGYKNFMIEEDLGHTLEAFRDEPPAASGQSALSLSNPLLQQQPEAGGTDQALPDDHVRSADGTVEFMTKKHEGIIRLAGMEARVYFPQIVINFIQPPEVGSSVPLVKKYRTWDPFCTTPFRPKNFRISFILKFWTNFCSNTTFMYLLHFEGHNYKLRFNKVKFHP